MLFSQVDYVSVAERLGIPAAVLFATLFFIWRASKALAPYFRKLFDKHLEFVDAAQESSKRCVKVSEQTTALLGEMCTRQEAISTAIGHSANAMEELAPEDKKDKVKAHTSAMRSDLGVG
jgi:hypothetical protein